MIRQSKVKMQRLRVSYTDNTVKTNSSAIAERPRCTVGQLWPKVTDDIPQTIYTVSGKKGAT